MNDTVKYNLDESQIPKYWYNIAADLPKPPPPVLQALLDWLRAGHPLSLYDAS